jgi:hypothetical protein
VEGLIHSLEEYQLAHENAPGECISLRTAAMWS